MNQRGQSLVLSLVFLTVLVGMAALVVDVGSWYRADRKLQANADAAALAAAQELPANRAAAEAAALDYAATNDGGSRPRTSSSGRPSSHTTRLRSPQTGPRRGSSRSCSAGLRRRAREGCRPRRGARQRSRSGPDRGRLGARDAPLQSARVLLGQLPRRRAHSGHADDDRLLQDGSGAFRLVNIDSSVGGTGLQDIAEWIRTGYLDAADVEQWYYSDPESSRTRPTSRTRSTIASQASRICFFPVYNAVEAQGAGFKYYVIGFAVFHVTSWDIHGAVDSRINGYFMDMVWTGVPASSGGAPNFGARSRANRITE